MLMAARDKYGEYTVSGNVIEDANKKEDCGKIDLSFGNLVFYNGGNIENDGLKNEGMYVESFDDKHEAIENE